MGATPTDGAESDEFTLEIEFSGLCMYIIDEENKRIGVALPDARITANNKHADGSVGIPHVGYLAFDMADTEQGAMRSTDPNDPRYQVIYRFDEEALDLGIADDDGFVEPMLEMPIIEKYAPQLKPRAGLFGDTPDGIVMRTILRGGSLTSEPFEDEWQFNNVLTNQQVLYEGRFAGFSTWTRKVKAKFLHLKINDFRGNLKHEIKLFPKSASKKIRLKIANLCADNPLEWPELKERKLPNGVFLDNDFKWFYSLLKPDTGDIKGLLKHKLDTLPVPELKQKGPRTVGEEPPDCTGTKTRAVVPI